MQRRLALFSVASIATCIALWLTVRYFLPDVMPAAWGQDPQPFWRLETAVLLTTLQWITGVVGLLSAAGAVVLQLRQNSAS